MPQTRRSQTWAELKQAGNDCFKTGQYGDSVSLYSQAIELLKKSGSKSQEDLCILYSNRAAAYLKDGNCSECIKDCSISLELVPFGIKSLLRRAAAYEAMEKYRQAYVDYKTALQINCNLPAAYDGTNRMVKALTEMDGPSWREKLPPIPNVPMPVKEKFLQTANSTVTAQQNNLNGNKQMGGDEKKAKLLKEEGNAFVKKGQHKNAVEKYTQSLSHDPTEVTSYTNRALCYLSLQMYKDALKDCGKALELDPANIKALYRRAQAHKELKNKRTCVEDLNSLLKIDPNNIAAQKLLQEALRMK
ncbi:mitochondrial import receptor subunit TOM34 [Tachysurus fulvidraco]|uniref:mitochondrial import receptor subunit TOM34 n=1 Tax=Tachysurus fulvidraco TaxID=1234273 RepID=UPI001FEF0FAF|nr:mitochondrial import receptor subunit TOM34 [Tachysurus fulvidraco]XP_027002950.2 mitochondrial import receptor subunit TOM34 [Tachysurus fulvidraco]